MTAHFKTPPYVSKKLRDFARGQDCVGMFPGVCLHHPETVVLAHYRFFGLAGIAEKPHDFLGAHLCQACHDALDKRNKRQHIDPEELLRALMQTQSRVYAHFRSLTP